MPRGPALRKPSSEGDRFIGKHVDEIAAERTMEDAAADHVQAMLREEDTMAMAEKFAMPRYAKKKRGDVLTVVGRKFAAIMVYGALAIMVMVPIVIHLLQTVLWFWRVVLEALFG